MSINRIRYQQQIQQLKAAQSIGKSDLATYDSRNSTTGLRLLETADGGESYANYLSNSIPNSVITSIPTVSHGLSGYINQKPH